MNTVDIAGTRYTVTPRGRIEHLATRPEAERLLTAQALSSVLLVILIGVIFGQKIRTAPETDSIVAIGLLEALSGLAAATGYAILGRVRTLHQTPEAWKETPRPTPENIRHTWASWGRILLPSRGVLITLACAAVLWAAGIITLNISGSDTPAGAVQSIAMIAMLPGLLVSAITQATVVWAIATTIVYTAMQMVSPRPASGQAGTSSS